jgi:hypothetical protein
MLIIHSINLLIMSSSLNSLTIAQVKAHLGVPQLVFGRSQNDKRIVVDNASAPTFSLKVQENIDLTLPIIFIYETEIQDGCFCNPGRKPLKSVDLTL